MLLLWLVPVLSVFSATDEQTEDDGLGRTCAPTTRGGMGMPRPGRDDAGAGGGAAQVRVLADPKNEVASAMGVVWKIAGALGHDRSKRCGRLPHTLVRRALHSALAPGTGQHAPQVTERRRTPTTRRPRHASRCRACLPLQRPRPRSCQCATHLECFPWAVFTGGVFHGLCAPNAAGSRR